MACARASARGVPKSTCICVATGDGKKKQLFGTYKVSVNKEIKKQTLDARGDDKLVYTAAVRLKKKTWKQADSTIKEWVDEAEVADTLFTD